MAGVEGACQRQAELTFALARHALVDLSLIFRTRPREAKQNRLPPEKLARLGVVRTFQNVELFGHMTVLDSGAASGRLAVVVRAAALKARSGTGGGSLASFAESALGRAEEYIFLERLEYLARGGRLSKTGAWFGDALGLAPVVSPFADGARKVALLRKPEARLDFACERVKKSFAGFLPGYVLIEHTDNRRWVEREVLPRLKEVAPKATLEIGPLSLTTGVHTGPGTWAVAFLPDATI